MTRAIIIGCGYVGKALAQTWMAQGLSVTATTTTPDRLPELNAIATQAIVLRGDDAAALKTHLAHQDVVVLSIGAPHRDAYEATYLNTAKTLTSVLPHTTVRQVIYTGSYAVYGDQAGRWVDEETAIAPANLNGEIMAETERILLSATTEQCSVCIFRLGGIYGPGRELVRIFGRAAGTTRPGDGSEPSNWIHLEDIVGAIDFARRQNLTGIYNLVQDVPPSRRDLLDQVCQAHGLAPIQWDPALPSDRPYNAKVSNQKLREAGYTFIHPEVRV